MKAFSDVFFDDRVPLALIVLTAEANNTRATRNARGLDPKRLTTEDMKGVVKALEDLGYVLYRNCE